jgi:outer membrane assembly lipoprotein YfiO
MGCSSAPDPPVSGGAETVAWAKALIAKGQYRPVVDQLERLVLNFPDREFSDEAQFLLGEAHMGLKEYILAESAFRMLIDGYPGSSYRDDAELAIAICYVRQTPNHHLDQSGTVSAERALQQFIEDHSNSPLVPQAMEELREVRERLALKLLDSARFYFKRGKVDAARIYLSQIEERFPGTRTALEARYVRGQCDEKEGDLQGAVREFTALLDELPAVDPLRDEILEHLSGVRSELEGA